MRDAAPNRSVPACLAAALGLALTWPGAAFAMDCAEAQTHAVWICESLDTGAGWAEVLGGTFTGSGYRIEDDPNSKLHWDLGGQFDRGHVEVVIEGLSLESLIYANMHLIELFNDGGHWSSDRAINVRAYGDDGLDEWGDVKLKIWDNPAALVAEARSYDTPWTTEPMLWSIDWDPTEATLAVNGAPLIVLDLAGMNTQMGHLWLPLYDWTADYSGVPGTVYRDLVLAADPPGEDPDTEGGQTTIDGDTLKTVAVEDTCVIAGDMADINLGASDDISVSGDGSGSPSEIGYLRFVVAGLPGVVTQATLVMHTPSDPSTEGGGGAAYAVADTSWTEDVPTWNHQPGYTGGPLWSVGTLAPLSVYTFDVTPAVTGNGSFSFALVSTDGNSGHYATKELALDMAPVLEVRFAEGGDDDTTPAADDDAAGDDTSGDDDADDDAADDDAAGDDDTGVQPPEGDEYGGACGACSAAGVPSENRSVPMAGLGGLGGVLAWVRRRWPRGRPVR